MEKIISILTCILVIGCSTSEDLNTASLELKSKLVGNWKYIGYFGDVADDEHPDGFYPTTDEISTIYTNATFITTLSGNPVENGNYTISNDSLLKHNNVLIGKIASIDNSRLIVSTPEGYSALSYEKVVTP
jgi:hypothetical protein